MKVVETTGRTVDEALDEALKELKVKKDDVEYEILENPNKGLFGLIGTKNAKIKVTLKYNPEKAAVKFLDDLMDKMEIRGNIETKFDGTVLDAHIKGRNLGSLIGRRGQALDSIQYLLNLVVNKETDKYIRVILDVEDYRKNREESLIELAGKVANRVTKTKKKEILTPMTPHERRIVHTALQEHGSVYTYSVGEEPFRKVVIDVK